MITSMGLPRLPRELVRHARLYALLDERPPLTVVRTPSGFGKTTLVAGWLRDRSTSDVDAVWITVRGADSGSDAFWRRVYRGLTESGGGGRGSRTVPPLEQVDRLLAKAAVPVLLVLDDYDQAAVEVDDELIDLVHRRSSLHVIVCVRDGQRLEPDRWLDIDGLMVTAVDLMLTADEIAELFGRLGVPDPVGPAADLAPQLGGWATAVRAVALGLRDSSGGEAQIEAAAARVRKRLGTVLLRQFDQATVEQIVFQSALLGTFSLQDLVRVIPAEAVDAARNLLHSGLVLVDNEGPTPRYQWPAFSQRAVIEELAHRYPDRERQLRQLIAVELHRDGRTPEAFAHAAQAEDWDLVTSMLDRNWGELFSADRDALRAVVDQAPESAVRRTTSLLALRELFNPDATANAALARATLPSDPATLQRLAESEHLATIAATANLVLVTLRQGGMSLEACHQADRTLAMLRAVPAARQAQTSANFGRWALQCGITYLNAGRINDAIVTLELAYEREGPSSASYARRNAAAVLAVAHCLLGSYVHASDWLTRAEQAPDPDGWARPYINTAIAAARALIAVAHLDRETAIAASERLVAPPPRQMLGPMFLHARARVALHWGDRVGIAHLLREQRENPPVRQQPRSGFAQRLLLADEIDLTMSLGAGSRAQRLLDDGDKSSVVVVRRGWLALRSDRPQEAFAAAAAALSAGQGNSEHDISALLLAASASRQLGETAGARRSSRLAIHRIAASGCRAPLELLTPSELCELRAETEDLEESRVMDGLDKAQEVYPEKIVVIALSERERAVLTHLAAGRTFADIAQADFVTLNTLKTQARSLYRKLDASDRESALRKAFDAGLL